MIMLDNVEKIARLAKIQLTPQEIEKFSDELAQVFKWVDQLENLCLQQAHEPPERTCPMVEDVPGPTPSAQELLANAPEKRADCFVVPKVLGDA